MTDRHTSARPLESGVGVRPETTCAPPPYTLEGIQ